jgi:ParB family chromosome partitioning protein
LGSLIPNNKSSAGGSAPQKTTPQKKATEPIEEDSSIDLNVANSSITELPVDEIVSNRHQPRKHFVPEQLEELSKSIREHGIIQPLVVVPTEDGEHELIAGERRLRASKMAGLKKVPVIMREASELERLELALIENIQRADLNPIEEAESYQKLNDEFGLTHIDIGKKVGKSRPIISNAIRLLSLPTEIQLAIAERKITSGHARAILEVHDEEKRMALFRKVIDEKLSIGDTTIEAKRVEVNRHTRVAVNRDPNIEAFERSLRDRLGTKVMIGKRGKNLGIVTIEFYGDEELSGLVSKILGEE